MSSTSISDSGFEEKWEQMCSMGKPLDGKGLMLKITLFRQKVTF